jgi:hypothetical protein
MLHGTLAELNAAEGDERRRSRRPSRACSCAAAVATLDDKR